VVGTLAELADIESLRWYAEHGVEDTWLDEAVDRTRIQPAPELLSNDAVVSVRGSGEAISVLDAGDTYYQAAVEAAKAAKTPEELKAAIANFDGNGLKRTASNLCFSDGNPLARIMLIGDVPGDDEDRSGLAFSGMQGKFIDNIFRWIDLSRTDERPENALYMTHILNWRPPGNRTPSEAEIKLSLPFIERHIQLIAPKMIVFCGAFAAKALLGRNEGITKLRKKWYPYGVLTRDLQDSEPKTIPSRVIFPPESLIKNAFQKAEMWSDLIEIKEKMSNLG